MSRDWCKCDSWVFDNVWFVWQMSRDCCKCDSWVFAILAIAVSKSEWPSFVWVAARAFWTLCPTFLFQAFNLEVIHWVQSVAPRRVVSGTKVWLTHEKESRDMSVTCNAWFVQRLVHRLSWRWVEWGDSFSGTRTPDNRREIRIH